MSTIKKSQELVKGDVIEDQLILVADVKVVELDEETAAEALKEFAATGKDVTGLDTSKVVHAAVIRDGRPLGITIAYDTDVEITGSRLDDVEQAERYEYAVMGAQLLSLIRNNSSGDAHITVPFRDGSAGTVRVTRNELGEQVELEQVSPNGDLKTEDITSTVVQLVDESRQLRQLLQQAAQAGNESEGVGGDLLSATDGQRLN